MGISPAYLNLIENNKRNIGGRLLHRIADELKVPVELFDGATDRRLVHDLVDIRGEALFDGLALTAEAAAGLAGQYPQWARALVRLHRGFHDRNEAVTALSDRLSQDPFLGESIHGVLTHVAAIRSASEILESIDELDAADRARFLGIVDAESARLAELSQALAGFFDRERAATRSITPADEVDDFLQEHDNYFPRLSARRPTSAARPTSRPGGKPPDPVPGKPARGARDHGGRAGRRGRRSACALALRAAAPAMVLRATAAWPAGASSWAGHPPGVRRADRRRTGRLAAAALAGGAAARRARPGLRGRRPAAALRRVHRGRAATRYDINACSRTAGASFEQVCHRLLTLKQPGGEGVRFGFMRSDPAGYVTKRFPLPYMPLPRYGTPARCGRCTGPSRRPARSCASWPSSPTDGAISSPGPSTSNGPPTRRRASRSR